MNKAERLRLASTAQSRPRARNAGLALSAASLFTATFLAPIWLSVAVIVALPAVLFLLRLLYEKALLLTASLGGVHGVVVTSDAQQWAARIDTQWLPRLSPSFIVLNWSRRHQPQGVGACFGWCLHRLFVGSNREYCPAVIVLRGIRYPTLFRFYRAFKESAQGRPEALATLETELFTTASHAA